MMYRLILSSRSCMTGTPDRLTTPRTSEQTGVLVSGQIGAMVTRFEQLRNFFGGAEGVGGAWEIVNDLEAVNARLVAAGREDLVITAPVDPTDFMDTDEPRGLRRLSNFQPNFVVYTGLRETGRLKGWGNEPELEGISVTAEELLDLRRMPILETYEEIAELRETGQFPAIYRPNHCTKPAFLRLLILFPEFTTDLVLGMSQPENAHHYTRFEMEFLVAHKLITRLVDAKDRGVTNNDGVVDHQYFYH